MATVALDLQHKTWTKNDYLVSTDPSLIPVPKLNTILASKEVYWAKSMPDAVLYETLQKSLCFGLYRQNGQASASGHALDALQEQQQPITNDTEKLEFIGIARCVTDFTTFIYLTDVYVSSDHQGQGLGSWLIGCVQEVVESMPYLRRSLLFTSDWERSVPFYEKLMGMTVLESRRGHDGKGGEGVAVLMRTGPGAP